MKRSVLTAAILALAATSLTHAQSGTAATRDATPHSAAGDVNAVSPALARYDQQRLLGEVWNRPGLSTRDRGLITVAALVARNHTVEMARYMNLALDNGVKPAELSELITHLAFYAGWGHAMAASAIAKDVYAARGIKAEQLPRAGGELLPLDEKAEAARAERVQADAGPVSPGLVQYTGDMLFKDLWLRPALAPRDRSLVTVTSLIANGQSAQMPFHLNKAMDNGLTKAEAGEVLSHLAFYVGWPNVFSAVPVAKQVFEQRAK
jgi:4-carboxymuconolactone decarboxylase